MKSSGEKFKLAMQILFVLTVISAVITFFVLIKFDLFTVWALIALAFGCYISYLPVLLADVLWGIEENTQYIRANLKTEALAPATKTAADTAKESVSPPTPIATDKKAVVSGDNIICPKCGTAQRKAREICWQCGTELKAEKEDG